MVDAASLAAGPLIAGIIGIALAVLQRGYIRFREEQKEHPDIKFGGVYLLNMVMAAGGVGLFITGVVPALFSGLAAIPDVNAQALTAYGIVTQAGLGYGLTYAALSTANTSTERKAESSAAKNIMSDEDKAEVNEAPVHDEPLTGGNENK